MVKDTTHHSALPHTKAQRSAMGIRRGGEGEALPSTATTASLSLCMRCETWVSALDVWSEVSWNGMTWRYVELSGVLMCLHILPPPLHRRVVQPLMCLEELSVADAFVDDILDER